MTRLYLRGAAVDRFWPRVEKTANCWLWTGATNARGYGLFHSKEHATKLAHRIAYEMSHGPIPEGNVLDHLCYVPACVRPEHLQTVTQALNMENRKGANRNSKTGVLGVSPYTKRSGQVGYRATFRARQLGKFGDIAAARAAVIAARNAEYVNNLRDRSAS